MSQAERNAQEDRAINTWLFKWVAIFALIGLACSVTALGFIVTWCVRQAIWLLAGLL